MVIEYNGGEGVVGHVKTGVLLISKSSSSLSKNSRRRKSWHGVVTGKVKNWGSIDFKSTQKCSN